MWLIYALMMLDSFEFMMTLFAVFSGAAWVVFMIVHWIGASDLESSYPDFKETTVKTLKKAKNVSLAIFIPTMLLASFVPNSKQAAIIYSVGSTIEYVQGNDKIKELPDKAVECLDKFISDYLEEDTHTNETHQ